MESWQTAAVGIYGLISLVSGWSGYRHAVMKGNVFGLTHHLSWLGIFVWGDAIIVGIAGAVAAAVVLLLNNWWFGLTLWSIFWAVRSHGETIYWLNQQFSPLERNPPRTLRGYRWFPNDSLWFVYQLGWQMITIASVVASLFFIKNWLFLT